MLFDKLVFHSHLHPEEKLIYVVHQHWFVIYKPVVKIGFFGMLIPALLWLMFPTTITLVFFGTWFVLGFLRFLYELIDWYFDVLLVTSYGIVDLDWRGFFDKSSSRIDYETVVGVSYDKTGIWSSLLNFGPLLVEKEGHGENQIALPAAADPLEAERQILLAREKYLNAKNLEDGRAIKNILSNMIRQHIQEERQRGNLADLL